MIKGRQFVERMYSDCNKYEDTKFYSTGDSLKDDLKEALKKGDTEKIKKLEKKTTRTGRLIGAGSGLGLIGARIYQVNKGGSMKAIKEDTYDRFKAAGLNDRQSKAVTSGSIGASYGISGAIGGGVGAGIGHAVGKAKFNKALKKAEKELEEEKKR